MATLVLIKLLPSRCVDSVQERVKDSSTATHKASISIVVASRTTVSCLVVHAGGRAIYASGSPQEDVVMDGKKIASSQVRIRCA